MAAVNNGGWEVQGAALLQLRQRLECAGLRLWSEGAMVQAGMTAVVTRARSWCTGGRCKRQWRLSRAGHSYGSCKGKDAQGYGRVQTKVQAETLTAALVA